MSILENWDEVREAQEIAAESAGSTERKYADYMDSLEAHMNQLSTTWSQFLMNMDLSGKATGVIDFIQNIVQVLDVLINKTPAATIAITALAAALIRLAAVNLTKMGSGIIDLANSIMSMGSKGGKSNIFSSLFGFLTNGAFTTGINNAQKGMQGLAKGGEAVAKAMSSGGKGFAQFGAAATAAMTSTATGAAGATTAVTTLGAAISTLAKSLGVIALIGTAIWGVSTLIDKFVVTDEELAENISTTQDNISEIGKTIEDYNTQLETNRDRIEEINSLKGTSSWSSELDKESESLEKQNQLLERKLALEERRLELEESELGKQINEQFDRDIKDISYKSGINESWGTSAFRDKIAEHNKQVDEAIALEQEYDKVSQDSTKTYEEKQKVYEEWQDAVDEANISEKDLTDTLDNLSENYDLLSDENKKVVDSMKEMANGIKLADSEFATYGEMLNYVTEGSTTAAGATQSLAQQCREIANIDFKPHGVEDMDEWLSMMDDEQIEHFKWMLETLGDDAQTILGDKLSFMSASDAIGFLDGVYQDYYGTINDCTDALNEFNTALNKDFDTQTKGIIQMLDYFQNSGGLKGDKIQNIGAYNAAKEGLGFEHLDEAGIKSATEAWNKYWDASTGNVKLDKFKEDMWKYTDILKSFNQGTEVQISDFGEMADNLGLTDEMFMALIHSAERYMTITETSTSNALQESLKQTAATAKDLSSSLSDVMSQGIDAGDITKTINAEGKLEFKFNTAEAKQSVVNELNTTRQEIQNLAQQSGLKVSADVDLETKIDANIDDSSLSAAYSETQTLLGNYEKLIDEAGNFDFSSITEGLKGMEGVTIDDDSITFDNASVAEKAVSWIEGAFEGVDVSSIINNMLSEGISFENVSTGGSGAEAFGEQLASQIKAGMSAQKIQLNEIIEGNFSQLGIEIDTLSTKTGNVKTAADDASAAMDTLDGKTVAAAASSMGGLETSASNTAGNIQNCISYMQQLQNNGSATVYVRYVEVNKPDFKNGGVYNKTVNVTKKTKAANGLDVPAYASGKEGKPLRQPKNANALTGEEGQELVIGKDGKQRIVGQNGPEFVHLRAGDTVIPANVTSMIKKGQIKAFAGGRTGGTLSGTSNWGTVNIGTVNSLYTGNAITGSSSSSSSKGSSSSSSSNKSSSSSSSKSSSSSSSDKPEDPAEDLIKELEHRLNMEYITEKQYAKELEQIWKTYYKNKSDFRDEDWKYEEELHDLRKQFIEEEIDALEYQNDILSRTAGTEQKQIKNLQRMQDLYHQQAEEYRANGFDDLSPEIRELSESWWSAYDEISDLQHQIFENVINDNDHEINILDAQLDRLEDFQDDFTLTTENLNNLLDKQLAEYVDLQEQKAIRYRNQLVAIETELARLMKQGYETNKELIQDLEEQAEDVKNNILDIGQSIKDMELSKVETQLNRQEEIRQGIIDYAETQIKMLEDEIELLEEENQKKKDSQELERLQEALDNAKKNRMKRVYHADTGWVWEQDKEAVDEAQQELDDFILQQKIDAIQEEIDNWNDYIEKVQESSEIYSQEQRKQLLEMEYGRDYGEQILQDMNDNLGLSVDNAVGILQTLIDQWNNLYEAQARISSLTAEEVVSGLDTSVDNTSGHTTKYDKNFDYQAQIDALNELKQQQINDMGTYSTWIDDQIDYYTKKRQEKIKGENLNEDGTPKTPSGSGGGSSSSSSSSSSGGKYYGTSSSGGASYEIGSDKGKDFVDNAKPGTTMTGGDGSSWTKNDDGSTTISKDGNSWTVGGSKKSYAEGGIIDYTGEADVHGDSQHSEVVFNSRDAKNLWEMIHRSNDKSLENDILNKLSSVFSFIDSNGNNTNPSININTINLPSVKNGNDFVRQLKVIALNR